MTNNAYRFRKSRERETKSIGRLLVYGAFCLSVAGCTTLGEQAATPKMTIGVQVETVSKAIESGVKTKASSGLYVMTVDAGHPAARAGIKRGDVLLACGAMPLATYEDYQTTLDALEPGSQIMFTIWRDGIQKKLMVKPEVATPAS
jgi:S1-C subfamily serine protease